MTDIPIGTGASPAQPDAKLKEQPAPGPDDVVTVRVSSDGIFTTIEPGAGKDTHPDGSGEKPTAERQRIAKMKQDGAD